MRLRNERANKLSACGWVSGRPTGAHVAAYPASDGTSLASCSISVERPSGLLTSLGMTIPSRPSVAKISNFTK